MIGMGHMFEDAIKFNADVSAWDVSKAANMGYLFSGCRQFNIDISAWKISSALQNITISLMVQSVTVRR